MHLRIHTDGGSRHNPGPAAAAFVITGPNGLVHQSGHYLGVATNNQAEYQGVIHALSWLVSQPFAGSTLEFYLDSQLVVNQLSGKYRVKDPDLFPLVSRIRSLLQEGNYVSQFHYIPREYNSAADALVNQALDTELASA